MSVKFCSTFPGTAEEILAKCLRLLRISTPSSSLPHELEVCVLSWSNLQKKIFDLSLQRREYFCSYNVKGGDFILFKILYLIYRRVTFQIYYSALLCFFTKKKKNFRSLK
jgi:hypothetical protein